MADEVKNEETPVEQPKEAPKAAAKTSSGLEPNVAALLAYLFGWLGGLVFYLIEKDNKFVRFAAMQSILFNVALFGVYFVLSFVIGALGMVNGFVGLTLGLVYPVLWIGGLIVWVMLMVKAYNSQEWELPVVGKIARNAVK